MRPPCNRLELPFITRAVFSKNLLKTAALFSTAVKLFFVFFQIKNTSHFQNVRDIFLSPYLNDIAASAVIFLLNLKLLYCGAAGSKQAGCHPPVPEQ